MQLLSGQTLRDRLQDTKIETRDSKTGERGVGAGLAPPSPSATQGAPTRAPQGVPLQIGELLNLAIQIAVSAEPELAGFVLGLKGIWGPEGQPWT